MWDTSARLLKLLSLLQSTQEWSGADLASRLAVSTRTVRRDIDRLRDLGYPVEATMGSTGGYRLAAGAAMPPLLLDDDEAIAIAIGLQSASVGSVKDIAESSVRALAKLHQAMPARVRRRFASLQVFVEPLSTPGQDRERIPAQTLTTITDACRDRELLRFDYLNRDEVGSERQVEPYRLVNSARRWYLVAYDPQRKGWRSFRVDRMTIRTPNGGRFLPRDPPKEGAAQFVSGGIKAMSAGVAAQVLVHQPADELAEHLRYWGTIEPLSDITCILSLTGESLRSLALWLCTIDAAFQILQPPELRTELGLIANRLAKVDVATIEGSPMG